MWQHITGEGTALVKEAEDAATNQVEYFYFFVKLVHVLYSCPLNYAMTLCINFFYAHDCSQFGLSGTKARQ